MNPDSKLNILKVNIKNLLKMLYWNLERSDLIEETKYNLSQ